MTNEKKEILRDGNPQLLEMGEAIADLHSQALSLKRWRGSALAAVVLSYTLLAVVSFVGFSWLEDLRAAERLAFQGEQDAVKELREARAEFAARTNREHALALRQKELEAEIVKQKVYAINLKKTIDDTNAAHHKLAMNARTFLLTFHPEDSEADREALELWMKEHYSVFWGGHRYGIAIDIINQIKKEWNQANPMRGRIFADDKYPEGEPRPR
jgi:hypothetical protein